MLQGILVYCTPKRYYMGAFWVRYRDSGIFPQNGTTWEPFGKPKTMARHEKRSCETCAILDATLPMYAIRVIPGVKYLWDSRLQQR